MGAQQMIVNNYGLITTLPSSQSSREIIYSKMESMHINDIQQLYILLFRKSAEVNHRAAGLIAYACYFIGEYIRVRGGVSDLRLVRLAANMET